MREFLDIVAEGMDEVVYHSTEFGIEILVEGKTFVEGYWVLPDGSVIEKDEDHTDHEHISKKHFSTTGFESRVKALDAGWVRVVLGNAGGICVEFSPPITKRALSTLMRRLPREIEVYTPEAPFMLGLYLSTGIDEIDERQYRSTSDYLAAIRDAANRTVMVESRASSGFDAAHEHNVTTIMPIRFQTYRDQAKDFSPRGHIIDRTGREISVWTGEADFTTYTELRLYAVDGDNPLGFLRMNKVDADTFEVGMSFVRPSEQRKGIGFALYRYALTHGVKIMSGDEMSPAAIRLWKALEAEPTITIQMVELDDAEHIISTSPLKRIEDVLNAPSFRLLAQG